MNVASATIDATRLLALSAWALEFGQRVKFGEHRSNAKIAATDVATLAVLSVALSACAAGAHVAFAGALAFGIVSLLIGVWIDAVLYRVYSIELGLDGLRRVVVPVLYREFREVEFARRFFREQRAFMAVPFVTIAAYVARFCPSDVEVTLCVLVAGSALTISCSRLRPASLLLWAITLASATAAMFHPSAWVAVGLAVAVVTSSFSAHATRSALHAFIVPRAPPRSRAFVPLSRDAVALDYRVRSPLHTEATGRLAGSNVVLWTFESMARDYVRAYGGPAHLPFLESLVRLGATSENHFAPCALTNDAHVALYHGDYVAPSSRSLLHAITAAGYRCIYLTSCRVSHYGLGDVLRHAGFDRLVDQTSLGGSGVGDRALLSSGVALIGDELRHRPYFLHVHTANSHLPYRVEDPDSFSRFDASDDRGRYLNSLEEADAILRAMAETIAASESGRETLWVVSADHGQAFGERGYRSHGSAVIKEQVNVPLVLHHPRLEARRFGWSSHLDVLPTVLDLLGIDGASPCRGASLYGPSREPVLVLSAGRPSRATTSNYGLILRDRKYMVDLVLDRCFELSWRDEGHEISGAEALYARDLVSRAFASVGLR